MESQQMELYPKHHGLFTVMEAWGNAGAGASTILRAIGVHHFAIFHDFLLDI
jgi:hypothetical protein